MDKRRKVDERGKWEMILREKLQDYEYPIGELPPPQLPVSDGGVHRWWVWIGVAAAAAVLLFLFLLPDADETSVIREQGGYITEVKEGSQEATGVLGVLAVEELLAKNEISREHHYGEATKGVASSEKYTSELTPVEEVNQVVGESIDEPIDEPSSLEGADESVSKEVEAEYANAEIAPQISATMVPKKSHQQLQLAINVSGAPSTGSDGVGMTTFNSELIGVMDRRYFETIEERLAVRELMPLEIGASLIVPLSDRWRVESGLQYTFRRLMVSSTLSPDFSMDIHAIGVPLNVQYIIGGASQWRWYVTGGVSGKLPLATILKGDYRSRPKTHFYVDTSLGLGAEYKLSKLISGYVSIGGAYDLLPLNSELFGTPASRLHVKMSVGLRFGLK